MSDAEHRHSQALGKLTYRLEHATDLGVLVRVRLAHV